MIDYTNYIFSLSLDLFKQVGNKFNARCPVCGDSQKNSYKGRLWFLPQTDGGYVVKCWNGGCILEKSTSLYNFIGMMDKNLQSELKRELAKEHFDDVIYKKQKRRTYKKEKITFEIQKDNTKLVKKLSKKSYCRINSREHKDIIDYCKSRKIPKNIYMKFYYCFDKKSKYYDKMIMPLYRDIDNKIYGFVARSIKFKRFLLSLTSKQNLRLYNIFNIDHKKTVFILESMIDSMFIDNSIAMLTAEIPKYVLDQLNKKIFVFDNDNTGIEKTLKYLKLGYKCVIFPSDFKYKDPNEAIVDGGYTKDGIRKMLLLNTHEGLEGILLIHKIIKKRKIVIKEKENV